MKIQSPEEIKNMVREQYSAIANQDKEQNLSSCCGSSCCSTDVYNIMSDDYTNLHGYNSEADLGLGCGLPTEFAKIKKGDVVIDLGSGAGNDCFIARNETGTDGKVIGIDFTETMIKKARGIAAKMKYNNVEFRLGDVEALPVEDDSADVIISNCVLNLVPNKQKAFDEIYRTLKPGGHFSISDVVIEGQLPEKLLQTAEMYAGCISGAMQKEEYMSILSKTGFKNIVIQKQKAIHIPDDILSSYLSVSEISTYKNDKIGIFSITVYGEKQKNCCGPECCN